MAAKDRKTRTNEGYPGMDRDPARYIISSAAWSAIHIPDMVGARFSKHHQRRNTLAVKEKTGSELPTHVMACGGGSSAAGMCFYHYLDELSVQLVAVEVAGMEGISNYSGNNNTTL